MALPLNTHGHTESACAWMHLFHIATKASDKQKDLRFFSNSELKAHKRI